MVGSINAHPLATLAGMKNAGVRIGVQPDLRDRFLRVCQVQNRLVAQVLREFVRTYGDEQNESPPHDSRTISGSKAKNG